MPWFGWVAVGLFSVLMVGVIGGSLLSTSMHSRGDQDLLP